MNTQNNPFEQASDYRTIRKLEEASSKHNQILEKNNSIESEAKIANKIKNKQAKPVFHHATKMALDKSLHLAYRAERITVVCPDTGAVTLLDIPSIPGFSLIYSNPLSDYNNCRGLAQQGPEYLRKLEAQTLCAILITLAEHYELFGFEPSATGASKNALLRKAEKNSIIDAIVMIEKLVHTGNSNYIPKLSLKVDKEMQVNEMAIRVEGWLKSAIEAIYKPDYSQYDNSKAGPKVTFASMKRVSAIKKENKAKNLYKRESYKQAKEIIAELYKNKTISMKLRDFLVALFTNDNLASADSSLVDILITKLDQIDSDSAKRLASIIEEHKPASEKDIFEDEEDSIEEQAEGHMTAPSFESISSNSDKEVEAPVSEKKNSILARLKAAATMGHNVVESSSSDF